MDKSRRTRKPTLITVAIQERALLEKDGVSNNLDVIDSVERRILGDLSLTGIDFRDLAKTAVEAEVKSRRPDWTQPCLKWFEDDLLIPIDEKGTQVRFCLATQAHMTAYEEIRWKESEAHRKADEAFLSVMQWIKTNLPGHTNLGTLMRSLGQ